MSSITTNYKIKNLIVIFITLFILLFFTKEAFYNMNDLLDQKEENTTKLENIVTQLKDLQKLEQDLKSWLKDSEIKYFMKAPTRADLIEYFHDYAEDVSNSWNELFIHDITFGDVSKSDLWFMQQVINLKVTASNKNVLKALLSKLTSDKSTYRFFITNFSFPNDHRPWAYSVTIPLKLLYK